MARIRKPTTTEPHATSSEVDLETGDDLRRFIDYAADMIAAQEAVRVSLADAAAALDKAVTGYDRTALVIARRERDGITVRLETDIEAAIRKVRNALSELKAIVPQWRAGFRSDPVRWKPARERVGRVTHLLRQISFILLGKWDF